MLIGNSVLYSISHRVRKNLKRQWKSTGDPTEVALQVFAMKLGLTRSSLTTEMLEQQEVKPKHALGEVISPKDSPGHQSDSGSIENEKAVRFIDARSKVQPKRYEMMVEFPFSSDLKRMTTIYMDKECSNPKTDAIVLTKGAVSSLPRSDLFILPSNRASYLGRTDPGRLNRLPVLPRNEPDSNGPSHL